MALVVLLYILSATQHNRAQIHDLPELFILQNIYFSMTCKAFLIHRFLLLLIVYNRPGIKLFKHNYDMLISFSTRDVFCCFSALEEPHGVIHCQTNQGRGWEETGGGDSQFEMCSVLCQQRVMVNNEAPAVDVVQTVMFITLHHWPLSPGCQPLCTPRHSDTLPSQSILANVIRRQLENGADLEKGKPNFLRKAMKKQDNLAMWCYCLKLAAC